jgi:signal peptidase II
VPPIRITRSIATVAVVVLALDAGSKSLARAVLPLSLEAHPHGWHVFGVVGLERVDNAGSALGFAQGGAAWMPLAVLGLVVACMLPRVRPWTPRAAAAAGLLAGGALGNLIDRIRFGAVSDFIALGSARHGAVLNPADIALAVGVALALTTTGRRAALAGRLAGHRPGARARHTEPRPHEGR